MALTIHTTTEKFEAATITSYFGFVFQGNRAKNWVRKSRGYSDVIVFQKPRFKMFSVPTKGRNRRFQIPLVRRAPV